MSLDIDRVKSEFFTKGFVHISQARPLSAAELLALAESFGPLLTTDRHTPDHPAIQIISDTGLFGDQELGWHNDFSYGEGGFFGTLLANREGGHLATTHFVDMETACAALPEDEQKRLRTVIGHYFLPSGMMSDFYTSGQEHRIKRVRSQRPLVFNHPVTNSPVLYFSPATLRRLRGGDADTEALTRHCEQFAFEHSWLPGDILLYDNFRMMHARGAFRGRRILWRIQFAPWAAASVPSRSQRQAATG